MVLTNERAEMLANYLTADVNKAKELVDLPVEDAVKAINADGYDFTVDELKDFGEILQSVAGNANADGEIDAEALDNVAGGVVISAAVLGAGVTLFCAGVTAGYKGPQLGRKAVVDGLRINWCSFK